MWTFLVTRRRLAKQDEKTALRKAQRAEAEPPTDETNPRLDEKQS